MSFQPRFVATMAPARYGSRDEFVGYAEAFTLAVAETKGWLDHQLAQLPGYWYEDGSVMVVDHFPERDAANWGPKEPCEMWRAGDNDNDADLPF